jgi:hypothetical protein
MKYFYLEPEVAGELGDNTVADDTVHPPIVSRLHYLFHGWERDVLLTAFPVWIVTAEAERQILSAGLTGATFDGVEVTTSDEFDELYPGVKLPTFVWLMVSGKAGDDDFGVANNLVLVVSERALKLLQRLGLANADIKEFDG